MKNAKVICFVATVKPEAARNFYQKVLGLKFVSEDAFAIVFDVGGTMLRPRNSSGSRHGREMPVVNIMLRVTKVKELVTAGYTVLGWEVADIVAEVKALGKKGVKCERYEFLEQDDLGVWSAPSGAKVAWFRDPDGNVLSLTQFK